MDNPQNLTRSPEFAPGNSVGVISSDAKTGTIIFNQPLLPPKDPGTIEEAIAGGDTTERRIQRFREAMDLSVSEQK